MSIYWIVSFLYTSLDAKLTLAAHARGGSRASRTRETWPRPRGVRRRCAERLANLPLLAGLGSAMFQTGDVACSDHWPAMPNRWFGWLSSPEPVAGSSEIVASHKYAGCEESSDEEALLGTIPVPQANI